MREAPRHHTYSTTDTWVTLRSGRRRIPVPTWFPPAKTVPCYAARVLEGVCGSSESSRTGVQGSRVTLPFSRFSLPHLICLNFVCFSNHVCRSHGLVGAGDTTGVH